MRGLFEYYNIRKTNAKAYLEKFETAYDAAVDAMSTAKDEVDEELRSAYLDLANAQLALATRYYEAGDKEMRDAMEKFSCEF